MANDGSTDGEAAIDPRYDPAFQRGFAGEVASAPRGQSTLRRTAAVNPPARQAVAAASPNADEAWPRPAAADDAVDAASAPRDTTSAGEVAGSVVRVTPRELARNPFVLALAGLAAVLVIAGVIWAVQGFTSIAKNGGTRNEVEFWAAQTMSFGAPLAIIVGLALGGVLLALFARVWQDSRER